jgi:hypothetical protein
VAEGRYFSTFRSSSTKNHNATSSLKQKRMGDTKQQTSMGQSSHPKEDQTGKNNEEIEDVNNNQ